MTPMPQRRRKGYMETARKVRPSPLPPQQYTAEDDPDWDCRTMGDKTCGPQISEDQARVDLKKAQTAVADRARNMSGRRTTNPLTHIRQLIRETGRRKRK